jgi:hypothetical protein
MDAGLFNYKLDDVETRVENGDKDIQYIVQLNRQRGEKKRTGVEVVDIDMSFDEAAFNFLKVNMREILMVVPRINSLTDSDTVAFGTTMPPSIKSPDLLIINAAPIAPSHSLFIPQAFDKLPQRITSLALMSTIKFFTKLGPSYIMGFNCLGAGASVNHCHFQCYELGYRFPLCDCECNTLPTKGAHVGELQGWPIRGLVFEIEIQGLVNVARDQTFASCMKAVERMQQAKIAHNICMLRTESGTIKVFLFPRATVAGVNQKGGLLDIAFMELGGHFICFSEGAFGKANAEECSKALTSLAIPDADFDSIKLAALATKIESHM